MRLRPAQLERAAADLEAASVEQLLALVAQSTGSVRAWALTEATWSAVGRLTLGAEPETWPRPGRGRGFYAAFGLDGGFYRPRVIELDANANPLPDAGFDYRGLIRLVGRWDGSASLPVDDQGRPRALFLAVARPDGEALVGAIADDLRVGWLEAP